MDKDCIKCKVTLVEGQNISTYHVNNKWYLCSGCRDAHNAIVNKNRMWVNGKYISFDHPLHKATHYTKQGDTRPLMMQPLLPWRKT